MRKICLIAVNARYTHSNAAVRYLQKFCADDKFSISIMEFSINSDFNIIADKIISGNFDAAGFSVYIWNVSSVKKIISLLKDKNFCGKIILGGPEAGYNAEQILSDEPRIDYIIKGFGENGLKYLLKSDFNISEKIISKTNPAFDEIQFLYEGDDFSDLKNRYVYYETSRGCPYRCAYCLSSAEGQEPDTRNIDRVKSELKYIIDHNPMIVKFVDRTFNFDKEHSRAIWKFLLEHSQSGTKFHFEINPDLLEDADFIILKNAPDGMFRFEAGIQSLNKSALEAVNRTGSWPRIKSNLVKLVSMKNIHLHVDLIAGLPLEDMNSFVNGFNELYSIGADHIQLGFLKLLPGTELRAKADHYGLVYDKYPPYEIINSSSINADEMRFLKKIESLVDNYFNSKKYNLTLQSLVEFFRKPFAMYSCMADFFSNNYLRINGSNSLECLKFFIEKKYSEQAGYLMDCLRWDFLNSAKNLRLPELLQRDGESRIKKDIWKKIRADISDENLIIKIQDGYIFYPESVLFQTRILQGNDIAVFFRGSKEAIFLNLH